MGQLQQISDLPVGHRLPKGGEVRWITHRPQGVELAQIVNVRTDALKYLAVTHVLPRVAPPGQGDSVAPSHAREGHRSWYL